MRYVNLHKRNTSKFHFIAKRVASVCAISLVALTLIVVPLTSKANDTNVKNNDIVEFENEYLGNDTIKENIIALNG